MQRKLNVARGLMYASVVLIVLFQAYWLYNEYKAAHRRLYREMNVVLRETFVKQQLAFIFPDSNIAAKAVRVMPEGAAMVLRTDSLRITADTNRSGNIFAMPRPRDIRIGRPLFSRSINFEEDLQKYSHGHLIIFQPISEADFKSGRLNPIFRQALEKANLPFEFTPGIHRDSLDSTRISVKGNTEGRRPESEFSMIMSTLDFGRAFPFLFPRILTQTAFSLIITSLVILAFWFMYRSLKQQYRLAAIKNDFISNMTHELKTPVATVSVAVEAIRTFNALQNPERSKEYLDIAHLELQRLGLLIDKVMRMAVFESGQVKLQQEPVDMVELINEVTQSIALQAQKVNGTIRTRIEVAKAPLTGDRLHLLSVLYNLLDNALKYRSEKPEIEVALTPSGSSWMIEVSDNGPGIDAAYQDKIFEKFFRVPQGDRHDTKGYGLGLSYVADMVQRHQGTISVKSQPGKGTTFTIRLPNHLA
ncbi:MAG: HAMP domain-containing histidine kinase [Chitinophagaceae bacterium]|nr:HAMP domain-containing histidine kinase [Chitinophagaceae bacterium]